MLEKVKISHVSHEKINILSSPADLEYILSNVLQIQMKTSRPGLN